MSCKLKSFPALNTIEGKHPCEAKDENIIRILDNLVNTNFTHQPGRKQTDLIKTYQNI